MSSSNTPETESAVVMAPADRRRSLRFPFSATVEMLETSSGAKITGRTADLGLGGCYIDTLSPLPVGTEVILTILKGNESFEAQGKVTFSQIGMGMGVAFVSAQPSQIRTFQKWIQEISGTSAPLPDRGVEEAASAGPTQTDNRAILSELILTLMKKKVLTEPEGKDLLKKLFQ
jgi:hypothetical protein